MPRTDEAGRRIRGIAEPFFLRPSLTVKSAGAFDAEIIELCVRWHITYRLSYRDLGWNATRPERDGRSDARSSEEVDPPSDQVVH